MIISSKRNFVFVHIPKTGGTSLTLALEERATADDILIGDTPKAQRRHKRQQVLQAPGRLWKHSRLRDVAGLYPDDAFIFTLVRNPWDRLVSYYHWLRDQGFDHPAVRVARAATFAEFLKDAAVQEAVRLNDYASYAIDANGRERCDLFARLEHPADLEVLWEHLGFRLSIPHVNRSDRNLDWRIYYDAETFEVVRKIAAEDIARFGYDTAL